MFGFFKRTEVQLSPPVKGRITNNGEFSFNEKIVKSSSPGNVFGGNISVSQQIYITKEMYERVNIEDKTYLLWGMSHHWRSVPILNELMLDLNADLQNKEVRHLIDTSGYDTINSQLVVSICHWKNDLIETYYNNELISSYEEMK